VLSSRRRGWNEKLVHYKQRVATTHRNKRKACTATKTQHSPKQININSKKVRKFEKVLETYMILLPKHCHYSFLKTIPIMKFWRSKNPC
jgi:hypothetical protein